jgi:hypothetical protein
VTGDGAYQGEMNDVALFERALLAAVPTQPDPVTGDWLVPRLAQIARTATIEADMRRMPLRAGARTRRGLVARVGIAVAVIPLAFAGLALAGVTVPGPARDAFDAVGIRLPNQPAETQTSEKAKSPSGQKVESPNSQGGGNAVSDAAKTQRAHPAGQGNSAAAHEHARQQRSKAQGEAKGHTKGKAVGLNEQTPTGKSGDTGPQAHSNAGGSAHSKSVQSRPPVNTAPFPPGNARGHSKQPNSGRSKK